MIEALYLEKLYANPADGHSLFLGILGKPDPFNALCALIGVSGYHVLTVILVECR